MSVVRIVAALAAVAALASAAAPQPTPDANDVEADMVSMGDIVDDPSADFPLDVNLELDAAGPQMHTIGTRGSSGYGSYNGGQYQQPKRYYSYTYCYKWRGSCHYPYTYDQDYAQHRCSLYENTYYQPCYKVCCDTANY